MKLDYFDEHTRTGRWLVEVLGEVATLRYGELSVFFKVV